MWACGFCFALRNRSADHLLISCGSQPARRARSALLHNPARLEFHLSSFKTPARPLSSSKAASKNGPCRYPDPHRAAATPRHREKVPAQWGRTQSQVQRRGARLCQDRLGSRRRRAAGHQLPAGKRPLAKGRNPPATRRGQPMPILRLLQQREGG